MARRFQTEASINLKTNSIHLQQIASERVADTLLLLCISTIYVEEMGRNSTTLDLVNTNPVAGRQIG